MIIFKEVSKNKTACPEINEFMKSKQMQRAYQTVKSRMSVDKEHYGIKNKSEILLILASKLNNLIFKVDAALEMCQLEYLINGGESIWCRFFDKETLLTFEYKQDIESNCKYGYRHDVTSAMTCDLFSSLLEKLNGFKNTKPGRRLEKMSLLFAESDAMLPFLTRLGVARSASNFDYSNIADENMKRKWSSSILGPTSANIAFVAYKCAESTKLPAYTLHVFHNANKLKVDGCKSTDCDLDSFLESLMKFKASCRSTKHVCKA
jgi:hypothetical protein